MYHHLTELRWHHPDVHIAYFRGITLCIGVDILTGDSDCKEVVIVHMDEAILRLRAPQLLTLPDSTHDIAVLSIYQTC